MRKMFTARAIATELIATMALLVLIAAAPAVAQTGSGTGATSQSQSNREAPVGHRQPRADQLPSEKNLNNPNDPLSKENAALDRKIRSICRGC